MHDSIDCSGAGIGDTYTKQEITNRNVFMFTFDFGSYFVCMRLPIGYIMMTAGETSISGVIALEFWCAYFIPIGILSLILLKKENI